MPVERQTKFEFVVNLKSAKALGVTTPPSLLPSPAPTRWGGPMAILAATVAS